MTDKDTFARGPMGFRGKGGAASGGETGRGHSVIVGDTGPARLGEMDVREVTSLYVEETEEYDVDGPGSFVDCEAVGFLAVLRLLAGGEVESVVAEFERRRGEVRCGGGASLCLYVAARPSTKDVPFENDSQIHASLSALAFTA